MKVSSFLKSFGFAFLTYTSALSADTLLDSQNFNVTLNLAPAHYLTVGDLDFGYVNPIKISNDDLPIESTTASLVAYSNSTAGQYVQIVASDEKYLSDDGYSFLMRGINDDKDSISFILHTSFNADGTKADTGVRKILPGYIIVGVDGSDANHKVVRDLWAVLRNNDQLKHVSSDKYLAVLTANHYSNQ